VHRRSTIGMLRVVMKKVRRPFVQGLFSWLLYGIDWYRSRPTADRGPAKFQGPAKSTHHCQSLIDTLARRAPHGLFAHPQSVSQAPRHEDATVEPGAHVFLLRPQLGLWPRQHFSASSERTNRAQCVTVIVGVIEFPSARRAV
jgi:hypothetical protein